VGRFTISGALLARRLGNASAVAVPNAMFFMAVRRVVDLVMIEMFCPKVVFSEKISEVVLFFRTHEWATFFD
jgi:hypothetical protein